VNLYPALVAQMGKWKYYIVKMKMRELASEVLFASEVYDDKTLDDAIQRDLKEGRVRKEIVQFLSGRPDRFFSSIVVAAIGGKPKFYPVQISDDPQFALFADQGLDQSFGVLTFDGEQKYYALDGQHRLKAIKTLLDKTDPLSTKCPEGFENEQVSVLVVVKRDEPEEEFLTAYRRLFSSLNRYAKATDKDTNIIMDEDDTFAILTRRIISEHEFFQWTGKESSSARVKTKGKNIRASESYFTSLQTLYAMNITWLNSALRESEGWGTGDAPTRNLDEFIRFRPSEEYLDSLFSELTMYWDAFLGVLPVLREQSPERRNHENPDSDHLLFWPIGQELVVRVARTLMDTRMSDAEKRNVNLKSVTKALSPLANIDWLLHSLPWSGLLLVKQGDDWTMRNEDRKQATERAQTMLLWLLKVGEWTAEDERSLRLEWEKLLIPQLAKADADDAWKVLKTKRV